MKKISLFFVMLVLTISLASAEIESVDYQFVVEDNGNTVVSITLNGNGEIEIPLERDVKEVKVEGSSYNVEGNILKININEGEKAVVLYKTALMTQKQNGGWFFTTNMLDKKNIVRVAMPQNTIINEIIPNAEITSDEFIKLRWEDINEIKINYSFPTNLGEEGKRDYAYFIIFGLGVIIIGLAFYFLRMRKKISARKEQILQTLGENENKIVRTMIEMKGRAKRSVLEKKLGIAKSSLAAAINNLERKKILFVDREFSKHLVKLEKWFEKL